MSFFVLRQSHHYSISRLPEVRDVAHRADKRVSRVDSSVGQSKTLTAFLSDAAAAGRHHSSRSHALRARAELFENQRVADLIVSIIFADFEGLDFALHRLEERWPCFKVVGHSRGVEVSENHHMQATARRLSVVSSMRLARRRLM